MNKMKNVGLVLFSSMLLLNHANGTETPEELEQRAKVYSQREARGEFQDHPRLQPTTNAYEGDNIERRDPGKYMWLTRPYIVTSDGTVVACDQYGNPLNQ